MDDAGYRVKKRDQLRRCGRKQVLEINQCGVKGVIWLLIHKESSQVKILDLSLDFLYSKVKTERVISIRYMTRSFS